MKKLFKKINIFSQKGVSIIEMILYMAILSVLLTILTSIFVSALDVQSESQATSSVEQDGNYILARLAYDIHRAQNINIPVTNGETNDNFQVVINGINYTYIVDANNNLILTDDLGINNLNNYGTNISGFSVQRLGNVGGVENTLKINFTITSRTKRISGFEIKNFQTNLSLRRQ
ncbi:MAG: prepilin-type N-terminal cleavage/methylation domain-containing protein [Candidatus Levybacteria bacterium]|nr:prepilin-type N-terminal cleavage/methylation domain-containing protein [Candidatus Levybacteria bacterium]